MGSHMNYLHHRPLLTSFFSRKENPRGISVAHVTLGSTTWFYFGLCVCARRPSHTPRT